MALLSDDHMCQLAQHSYSNIPILPPYSNWKQNLWRKFQKKLLLPSMNHPLSAIFFRSSAALAFERKRYIHHHNWYIIHPFSNMLIVREILQFIVWSIAWIYFPYYKTFIQGHNSPHVASSVYTASLIIYYLSILLYFITGTYNIASKEIEIEWKNIVSNYLFSYCLVDFFTMFPMHLFTSLEHGFFLNEFILILQVSSKFIRLPGYFTYFRQITHLFKVDDMLHDKLRLPITSVLIIHWCACGVYICYLKTNEENSWFLHSLNGKSLNHSTGIGFIAYQIVMGKMICIFLRAGTGFPGDRGSRSNIEQMALSLVMILAFILHLYVIIVVLQLSRSANASEYKYEEIVCQLKHFMRYRDLPYSLRYRILQYYQHRYQNHYFKEESIQAAISGHLYHEIFLKGCARLIETTLILQGLSRNVIGEIIICLTPDVLLTNDYLIKANEPAEYLYFISYGTAAMYSADGEEIAHLEDGDLVGLLHNEELYEMDVIAIEITEVLRWNKKDYLECVKRHESLAKRIELTKQDRENYIKEYRYKKESDRYTGNVLYQLGRGRIADKLIKRPTIFESLQD